MVIRGYLLLRNEIVLLLIVKLLLLMLIGLLFFSEPMRPSKDGTARHLLDSSQQISRGERHE